MSTPYKLGCIKGPEDRRDIMFAAPPKPLPAMFNLKALMPPVYDQGPLGSCTANAIGALHQFKRKAAQPSSRLFIYYEERVMEDTIDCDCGAIIRDGMKVLNKTGAPLETAWPYKVEKFAEKPNQLAYSLAAKSKISGYAAVGQNETMIKIALTNNKPVVFGFLVKESFMSSQTAKTGVYTPMADEQTVGGHAVAIVGYDDTKKVFIVRNSWGVSWGAKGYFTMPYSEVLNKDISFDFWVIN